MDLETFGTFEDGALMVLGGRIGVVEMDGRLRAAGSMSGILEKPRPRRALQRDLRGVVSSPYNARGQTSPATQFGDDPEQFDVVVDDSKSQLLLLDVE